MLGSLLDHYQQHKYQTLQEHELPLSHSKAQWQNG